MNSLSIFKIIACFGLIVCVSSLGAKTVTELKSETTNKLNNETVNDKKVPQQCVAHSHQNNTNNKINTVSDSPLVLNAIYLEADTGQIRSEGTSTLNGNVIIQQNTTIFNANSAQLNRQTNEVKAQGNVLLSDKNLKLQSPAVTYNLKDKTGVIKNAEYALGTEGAHGKSTQIEQLDQDNLRLKDATFSSCPIDKESWHLASGEINLNKQTQIGTAKNVTFNVGQIPIFYFPWLKFPINNQRLSGFLSPSVRLQDNAGISIPYYFNLAPNYDATLRFTTINNRGYQLDTEFRYLTEKNNGTLEYSFIPSDESFDDEKRDYFKIKHRTQFDKQTQLKLNAEGVSDEEYFDDFSNSLETSTRPALERRLEISNTQSPWKFSAALEDYQVLDIDYDPYSKLPEIKASYSPKSGPKDLKLDIDSEIIYFDKTDDITGTRADIKFKVGKKWGEEAWYFKPSLSVEHTVYSLENTQDEKSLSRTLPTFTLDGGLFFDREIYNKKKQTRYTQTLEPRIFYTYTPFKDQSAFPVFDTARTNFSESNQLFLENRFTGKDRIADTNQLTFAVSSRIQDRENGVELFKASIGQVFNFTDRKVTLPGGTILTGKRSDLLLELTGRINNRFRLASTINLKSDDRSISNYDLRLNYHGPKKRILNLSFRKLNTELEQVSFSAALPINDKWSVVASTDHDTQNDRNLESLIGLEYSDCCWKTRLVMKRYLTSDNISYENPVFLEFELKGLGNIGKSATRQIKEKIYGYDDF